MVSVGRSGGFPSTETFFTAGDDHVRETATGDTALMGSVENMRCSESLTALPFRAALYCDNEQRLPNSDSAVVIGVSILTPTILITQRCSGGRMRACAVLCVGSTDREGCNVQAVFLRFQTSNDCRTNFLLCKVLHRKQASALASAQAFGPHGISYLAARLIAVMDERRKCFS